MIKPKLETYSSVIFGSSNVLLCTACKSDVWKCWSVGTLPIFSLQCSTGLIYFLISL